MLLTCYRQKARPGSYHTFLLVADRWVPLLTPWTCRSSSVLISQASNHWTRYTNYSNPVRFLNARFCTWLDLRFAVTHPPPVANLYTWISQFPGAAVFAFFYIPFVAVIRVRGGIYSCICPWLYFRIPNIPDDNLLVSLLYIWAIAISLCMLLSIII